MKLSTFIITIGLGILLILLPLTPAINTYTTHTTNSNNPLFTTRITRLTTSYSKAYQPSYIGQYSTTTIPIPSRRIITPDLINQLQQQAAHLQNTDSETQAKWTLILDMLPQLLDQLNNYYRENNGEIKNLLTKFNNMDKETLTQQFFDQLHQIKIDELYNLQNLQTTIPQKTTNITSGLLCNITSGSICSITSQPICALTLHPICTLITMTPMCNTMMGLRCPTAGIKCVPPTTGALCLFLANLGPILKALLLITVIGFILFLPALVLVTIFVPDICSNLKNRVTIWLNCSSNNTIYT